MSNRTLSLVRLVLVICSVSYAIIAVRTTAYFAATTDTLSGHYMSRYKGFTWWNLPPYSLQDWFYFAFLAVICTILLAIALGLLLSAVLCVAAWVLEPLSREATEVLQDDDSDMNVEPDIVEVTPLPTGEYSQPPKPPTPLTYSEALEDRLRAANPIDRARP